MTDSEIDAIATGILLLANEEKWYEQKERIKAAISAAQDEAFEYAWEGGFKSGTHFATHPQPVPRDFSPGHRQVNEEG